MSLSMFRALFWKLAYNVRQAVPLYSDDTGRIPSAYRLALIDLFNTAPDMLSRMSVLQSYARTFSNPVAASDLASHFIVTPDYHILFEHAYTKSIGIDGDGNLLRLMARLHQEIEAAQGVDLDVGSRKIRKFSRAQYILPSQKTVPPSNETTGTHWQVVTKDGRYRFAHSTPPTGVVALFLDTATPLSNYDFSLLADVDHVYIVPTTFGFPDDRVAAVTKKICETGAKQPKIEALPCLRSRISSYSTAETEVSNFCDKVSERVFRFATKFDPSNEALPTQLRDVLTMNLSDGIYRAAQKYFATLTIAQNLKESTPSLSMIISDPNFAAALSQVGPCWFIGKRPAPQSALAIRPAMHNESFGTFTAAMLNPDPSISNELAKVLRSRSERPYVVISTVTRMEAYRKVVKAVEATLGRDFEVRRLDFTTPVHTEKKPKASKLNPLFLAKECDPKLVMAVSASLGVLLSRSLSHNKFAGLPAHFAYQALIAAAARQCPAQIFVFRQFKALLKHFETYPPAMVLAIPGRAADVRCTLETARAAGIPSADLQALFVSKMPRYRTPIADQMLTMDRPTEKLYLEHFGVSSDKIEVVGSVQLDAELAAIRTIDPQAARTRLTFASNSTVFTYALQTFPEDILLDWTKALAVALSGRPNVMLCVKLHPAHPTSLCEKLTLLLAAFPALASQVCHKTQLTDVLAASDVLITHYSNVGITASAMGIPVLSLPPPDGLKGIDLTELGIGTAVPSESDLEFHLNAVLTKPQESSYFTENPEMGDGQALERISAVINATVNRS